MLLVNTRVGQSKIHGLGLFAQQFIPEGTLIWAYQPGYDQIISAVDVARLPVVAQQRIRHYAEYIPGLILK